jgi:hypothetical protein
LEGPKERQTLSAASSPNNTTKSTLKQALKSIKAKTFSHTSSNINHLHCYQNTYTIASVKSRKTTPQE